MLCYGNVIEFVIVCQLVSPDSSWRSTAAEINDEIVEFSHRFASITFDAGTNDLL